MPDRSVTYRFDARFDGFRTQMAAANKSVKEFGNNLTGLDAKGAQMRQGLDSMGRAGGRIGLLAAGGLAASAKAAIDWESAWAGVTKTVDGSAGQMERLEGDLREMARTLPATHQEIAAVAEAAGQLGIESESVASFTETMIALGESTNLTAEEAATSIARLTNIMGSSQDDVERIGSALVDLGNNSATTEAEILMLGQRLAAAGAIAGLSESDVLAFAATLTSVGVEAEAGGTALSKVFTTMRDAVINGGKDLDVFAQVAGTTADDFAQSFREGPAQAVDAFIQGLGELNARGESTSQIFDTLSLTDQRLMRALLSTAEAGDLLSRSLELGADAFDENSALAEEFGNRLGTTESQATIAWNNIKDSAIEAGEVLLPVIGEAAEGVSDLAQLFGDLPDPVQNTVVTLGGLVALFGGGLWFTAKTINGIVSMRTALSDLGVQAPKTSRGLAGIGRTAAGIAAAAVALSALSSALEGARRINTADIARDLEALMLDGRASETTAEFAQSLQDVNRAWSDGESVWRPWEQGLRQVVSGFGLFGDTPMETALKNLDQVDQSLANLVESGHADEAERIFGQLANIALENGVSVAELTEQLDAYGTELDNTDAAEEYNKHVLAMTDANKGAAEAIERQVELTEDQKEALADARTIVQKATESFGGLGESVNDAEVSLREWSRQMVERARAIEEFGKNAETAGKRGVEEGLIASLIEMGEEGALRLAQLANASDKEIAKVNEDYRTLQGEIAEADERLVQFIAAVLGVPPEAVTELRVEGVQQALGVLDAFRRQVINNPITQKVQVVYDDTTYDVNPNPGGVDQLLGGNADGGTIPGSRYPYRDKVLRALAPGEEVIRNRNGEAERDRPLLKAINSGDEEARRRELLKALRDVPGYADGGTVGGPAVGSTYKIPAAARESRLRIDVGDVVVRGTVDTPFGPAQVEGVARAVVRDEMDEQERWARGERRAS